MSETSLKPRDYRMGIILGAFLYWIFGIVDPFMLPEVYLKVWYFRYVTMTPGILLSFFFSYSRYYEKYHKIVLFVVTLTAQIGIVYMVYLARPSEQGYFAYYSGLVTTLFWSTFLFRFKAMETTIQFLLMFTMYNSVIIFKQNLLGFGTSSIEFAWFVENNFILIASGVIAIISSYKMSSYRKRIEEENLKYQLASRKAEESDMLKSAFLANMSHEIRTPLNSILGFSELLMEDDLPANSRNTYNEMIKNGGEQLLRIIGDILDISKIESNQMKIDHIPVDLSALLNRSLGSAEKYRETLRKDYIKLKLVIPSSLDGLHLKSDPFRLNQVLDNLITNALKNTEQGEVEFGIHGIVKIAGENKIEFYVKDTGVGIKPENFKLIFERFGRIMDHRIQRGNGIGLCITKSLVELLGGNICLDSDLGKGTTFYFNIHFDQIPTETSMEVSQFQNSVVKVC